MVTIPGDSPDVVRDIQRIKKAITSLNCFQFYKFDGCHNICLTLKQKEVNIEKIPYHEPFISKLGTCCTGQKMTHQNITCLIQSHIVVNCCELFRNHNTREETSSVTVLSNCKLNLKTSTKKRKY